LPPQYIYPEEREHFGLEEGEWCLGKSIPSDNGDYGSEEEYVQLLDTFPELYRAALIREVHVYGAKQSVSKSASGYGAGQSLESSDTAGNISEKNSVRDSQSLTGQSKGYGSKLVADAERIALSRDYKRVAVIAGVGTKMFYRLKLGYTVASSYMVKDLEETGLGRRGAGGVNTMHLDDAMSLTIKVLYATGLLFLMAVLLPIPVMMVVASVYILCIDWLHFFTIDYSTNNYNKSMLRMTRGGLVLVNIAIAAKWLSLLQPKWSAASMIPMLFDVPEDFCFCKSYWSTSLLAYVAAFYTLKLIFFKKTIIICQNPIFGNDRGINAIPGSVGGIMIGQAVACATCEIMMVNMTWSHCSADSELSYDMDSAYACHDTFDSMDIWFAFSAIAADVLLFASFCNKWHGMMFILMEEMATSMLIQFGFVCIQMFACCMNALLHIVLMYKSKPGEFDSFFGTGSFCMDCMVMATCLTLSSREGQVYVVNFFDIEQLKPYYKKLAELDYGDNLIV